jgi:hypothetical protein
MCAGQEPKHAHGIQGMSTVIIAARPVRKAYGAVHQFSRNHAVATSLPTSRAIPIAITGQNAPPKMAVNPSMEKAAETLVSASAADSVANVTGVLRCSTAETGATGVTGATGSVTASVTPL